MCCPSDNLTYFSDLGVIQAARKLTSDIPNSLRISVLQLGCHLVSEALGSIRSTVT